MCSLEENAQSNRAQFLGHNFTGDMVLMAGTQAPPGRSLALVYLRFDGETLSNRSHGHHHRLSPGDQQRTPLLANRRPPSRQLGEGFILKFLG